MTTEGKTEEDHLADLLNRGSKRNHTYFGLFLISLFLWMMAFYYFTQSISAFVTEAILGR